MLLKIMQKSYDGSFMKIFAKYDKNNIRLCQYYCKILPMNYQIDLKRLLSVRQLKIHPDCQLLKLLSCFSKTDRLEIKYKIDTHDTPRKMKLKFYNHFQTKLHESNQL